MTVKSKFRKAGSYRAARREFERELGAAVRAARDTVGEKMMARAVELGTPATLDAFMLAMGRAWRATMHEIDGAGSAARAKG